MKNFTDYSDITSIRSRDSYIVVYTIFILGSILLTSAGTLLYYKVFINASINLHDKMFSNILKAPKRFFDTNPSGKFAEDFVHNKNISQFPGRILNRFSKDMGTVDESLPNIAIDALQVFLIMCGTLITVFIVIPWIIGPAIVLGIIFFYFRVVYMESAQDIKRLEATSKSTSIFLSKYFQSYLRKYF